MTVTVPADRWRSEGIAELAAYFEQWSVPVGAPARGLCLADEVAVGHYDELKLKSAFQPLFDTKTMRAVAYEALLRAEAAGGQTISPAEAFAVPGNADELIYFDRLCRMLHVVNFIRQANKDEVIFLNVDGRQLLSVGGGWHGSAFETLLSYCDVRPEQVVLEIVESGIEDLHRLVEAVSDYQARGFRVAIDDFGSQESNFDRIWQMSPEFVKLDRSLIVQSTVNPRARKILPKLVEILHDLDARVVCEGIETGEQDRLARDAGVDLLQGYLYARPTPRLLRRTGKTAGPVGVSAIEPPY